MVYYEEGAELSFEPSECFNMHTQEDMVYESVNCPRFMVYTKANQDEIAAQRQIDRENTDKWNSLDDDYSKGGYQGDPTMKLRLKTQAMLGKNFNLD